MHHNVYMAMLTSEETEVSWIRIPADIGTASCSVPSFKKNQLAIMRSTENKSVSCCLIQLRSVSSYSDMNQHDYKACADKTNSNWQQFMNCFYWPSDYHISTMPYMMHHYIFSHRISKWNGLDWHKNKEVFSEENTCDLLKQANLSKWTDGQTQWWRSDPNVQTCWHTTWC